MNFNVVKTSKNSSSYSIVCSEYNDILFTQNKGISVGIIKDRVLKEYKILTENSGATVITTYKQKSVVYDV